MDGGIPMAEHVVLFYIWNLIFCKGIDELEVIWRKVTRMGRNLDSIT